MFDWLMMPLSGASEQHIPAWAYWHARWMLLGWGVLMPAGALAARYFKVIPRQRWPQELDSKACWHSHRSLQWAGIAATTIGAMPAWGQGQRASTAATAHAWAGWALVALGWLQVAVGLARGSKGGPTDRQLPGDQCGDPPLQASCGAVAKA